MNNLEQEIERFNDCLIDFLTAMNNVIEPMNKDLQDVCDTLQELTV